MYTLHNDPESFKTLILQISEEKGILPEIIEKDYFVTLILLEIASKQERFEVFFKGGTALYKALKCIKRFSEDIDLTFNDSSFPTTTAKKKALKDVTSNYTSLKINSNDDDRVSGSGSRVSVFVYDSLFLKNSFESDTLSRIGKVKIETTSFTTSAPITTYEIEPILYLYANSDFKEILRNDFNVFPFFIKCITIQRIFIDKIFAIEDYFLQNSSNRYIEMAKHMYDVLQLFCLPEIEELMNDKQELLKLIALKEEEQIRRNNAKTLDKKIHNFEYFSCFVDVEIAKSFSNMEKIYIFQEEYKEPYDRIVNCFNKIKEYFVKMNL